MKKIFLIIIIIFITNFSVFARDNIYSQEYLQKFQNSFIRKERFYALYYNALQMTPEQIDKYEDITESDKSSYNENLAEIVREVQKYQIMKDCYIPDFELKKQRRIIRKLYKNIKKASRNENKKLKKILTRDQRSNYNMIKHLERHDLKKNSKNYYKLNPKMPFFGNLEK